MNTQSTSDTICAPATIPGTGAISIIRVSGREALTIADILITTQGKLISETAGYRLRYGSIFGSDGTLVDNVLVSVFRAPHSYTGEDSIEISCHASKYIAGAIMERLVAAGARMAMPGEFTQRAFVNGKLDLSQAEAVADVIASQNAASHRVAMSQLKGGISDELARLREQLLRMTSLLELELDFSEEEVEFAGRSDLIELVEETLSRIERLTDSFSRGNAIRNGIPVVIAGATNTGKSTLLNALLGEDRAIVSDIAGTTRDTIEECLNIGGLSFRFIDTAGIRQTDEAVEKIGIERTFRKMDDAAIVLGMTDLSRGIDAVEDDAAFICQATAASVPTTDQVSSPETASKRTILLLNKTDIAGNLAEKAAARIKAQGLADDVLPISAHTGDGLAALTSLLSEYGSEITGDTDEPLVTNLRHYEALNNAALSLRRVRKGLSDTSLPSDLLAQDLREALYHLGEITGEITTDEVLGEIFGRFCIGK